MPRVIIHILVQVHLQVTLPPWGSYGLNPKPNP